MRRGERQERLGKRWRAYVNALLFFGCVKIHIKCRQPATSRPFDVGGDADEDMRMPVDTVSDGEAIINKSLHSIASPTRSASRRVARLSARPTMNAVEDGMVSAPESVHDPSQHTSRERDNSVLLKQRNTLQRMKALDREEQLVKTREDRLQGRDQKRAARRHP